MLAVASALSAGVLSTGADAVAETVAQAADINPDGTYAYSYQTSNGISGSESGTGGVSVSGSSSWTAPDGTPVKVDYVADENGYVASGAFIPVGPPAPAYVQKAIDYIAAHPSAESQDGSGAYNAVQGAARVAASPFRAAGNAILKTLG